MVVVVEVIRFVWLLFFLWRDTKGVFIADSGEIRHSLYVVVKNESGAFTIAETGLDGGEFGGGVDGVWEELGDTSQEVVGCVCMFHVGMVAEGGGWWQGGVGIGGGIAGATGRSPLQVRWARVAVDSRLRGNDGRCGGVVGGVVALRGGSALTPALSQDGRGGKRGGARPFDRLRVSGGGNGQGERLGAGL